MQARSSSGAASTDRSTAPRAASARRGRGNRPNCRARWPRGRARCRGARTRRRRRWRRPGASRPVVGSVSGSAQTASSKSRASAPSMVTSGRSRRSVRGAERHRLGAPRPRRSASGGNPTGMSWAWIAIRLIARGVVEHGPAARRPGPAAGRGAATGRGSASTSSPSPASRRLAGARRGRSFCARRSVGVDPAAAVAIGRKTPSTRSAVRLEAADDGAPRSCRRLSRRSRASTRSPTPGRASPPWAGGQADASAPRRRRRSLAERPGAAARRPRRCRSTSTTAISGSAPGGARRRVGSALDRAAALELLEQRLQTATRSALPDLEGAAISRLPTGDRAGAR